MYSVIETDEKYITYREENPLFKRISKLQESKSMGFRIVVYIVPTYYSQTVRYRAENMVRVINKSSEWRAFIFETFNANILVNYIDQIDVIICTRTRYDELYAFIDVANRHNVTSYYDIDDFRFSEKCITPSEMGMTVSDINYQYQKLANQCQGFITTTLFLQKEIERLYRKKTYLIRNFLDYTQSNLANQYCKEKMNELAYDDTTFCLGYYASDSHYRDLSLIADELVTFIEAHKDVEIRIGGMSKVPAILENDTLSDRVKILEFMDGYKLMKEFAEVDVNLIPLILDDYSEARSEIKYFEAGSVGTLSIMSPSEVYKDIVWRGNKGVLCEQGEWNYKLEKIYKDKKELQKNSLLIHNQVEREYSASLREKEIIFMLNEIMEN